MLGAPFTSLANLWRPSSAGGTSKGSDRSPLSGTTRLEVKEELPGVANDPTKDITQKIRAKLTFETLITVGSFSLEMVASLDRIQAHAVATGPVHTLGVVSSQPIPTPAVVRTSPSVRRRAPPPYNHAQHSTRRNLDGLGLAVLRAMVDMKPYGATHVGLEPPTMLFPSSCAPLLVSRTAPTTPRTLMILVGLPRGRIRSGRRRRRIKGKRGIASMRARLSPRRRLW